MKNKQFEIKSVVQLDMFITFIEIINNGSKILIYFDFAIFPLVLPTTVLFFKENRKDK